MVILAACDECSIVVYKKIINYNRDMEWPIYNVFNESLIYKMNADII